MNISITQHANLATTSDVSVSGYVNLAAISNVLVNEYVCLAAIITVLVNEGLEIFDVDSSICCFRSMGPCCGATHVDFLLGRRVGWSPFSIEHHTTSIVNQRTPSDSKSTVTRAMGRLRWLFLSKSSK